MNDTTVVALLSLAGTLIGSLAGILASNRLTNWRIEQLEKKMDKHNGVMERTCLLENRVGAIEKHIEDDKGGRP